MSMKGIGASLILFVLPVLTATAQTRDEAEAWIIRQTQFNVPGLTYLIEEGELVRRIQLPSMPGGSAVTQQSIPINQIVSIAVTHTDRFLSYALACAKPCVEQIDQGTEDQFNHQEKRSRLLFEIYTKFDASFPPRMNKALLRLVELHGGKAKLTVQALAKEAF